MQRTSDDVEGRLDVSELIERINAERGHPLEDTGRHRLLMEPDPRRSRRRRLAPAIVGVVTVLVAGTIALTVRPGADTTTGPELDAALVGASSPSTDTAPSPGGAAVPLPPDEAATGPTVPAPGGDVDVLADAETGSAPAPEAARAAAPAPGTAKPAAPKPAKPAPAVDGTQAATAQGWKLVDRDEFTGSPSEKWGEYEGSGHGGEGRRTADAISVRNGSLVVRGDEEGNTGGLAWADSRSTGRWEMRAKFPEGDAQYHPVLLLWPEDGGSDDGEVDFAETTSASDSVSFFLHHGSGDQETAKKKIDITQWHNYAVEVTSDGVTGYLDGQKWFESTDPDTLPRGPVHPVIQLDWFPEGDSPEPTEILVDWMRIYE